MPTEIVQPAVAPAEVEAPAPAEVEEDLTIPGPDDWEMVDRSNDLNHPYIVILYNCDCHTFDEVILQMQKATGCTLERAQHVAHEVDAKGRAIAFAGTQPACEKVAAVLREIKLQVETDRAM
jgi:ATP-dependent Clp protease adaptor protein ClpS